MTINLTVKEFQYLFSENFLPSELLNKIYNSSHMINNSYEIIMSEDEANIARDLCGELLQIKGFDENYEPSQEGIMLENLIDKFFA
ncbi:MAG: hypothetical protein AB4372_37745 [Xenococcus sp. (in: cyanobacteria)]